MAAVAAETSLTLVPASTNLRELEPADHFFQHYLHSALLASIGHSLTGEIRSLAIASTHDDTELAWGSHAYLDPLYSSGALKVTHDLPTTSRYEKTQLIADWPAAQSHMKVCFVAGRLPTGTWNCCECEKCIRTMLSLMSMSKLEKFEVFERSQLAPEDVDRSLELGESSVRYYAPIISAFEKRGDTTMMEVLRRKVREAREHQTRNLLQRFKAFDKNKLGGGLRRMKRRLLD